ncbi:metal ABC transporter solute-binding protein, Zn/Mn family [Natribacillus halophilus]|uniref:Zinc transport system substrate-binding protein n=1 Tax=Natribacillus halophilus TaxID=549003 RepID=A0A1G8LLU6_9BACI|nr:zinc ABC transporter substrate-binding protein [Natribacillus halophilus]SDI56437.1 zinc transport system substrate-binding protein [Natribacillus halophilus]
MKKKAYFIAAIGLSGMLFAGCQAESSEDESDPEQLMIYTTVFALEDFASKIGGDYVEAESIYPPNADAHTFEPSANEMVELAEGDAFIYSGVGMEGFVDTAEDMLGDEDVAMVPAGEGVDLIGDDHDHEHDHDHDHDHEHGDGDPHIFLDPIRSIEVAENVKNTLVELHPEQEEYFTENYEVLRDDLEELDQDLENTFAEAEREQMIVSHAAYGYWEERYGLEQLSVLGLSSTEEPSQSELTEIVEIAEEDDIGYIVFENNVSSTVTEVIQEEIGAESLILRNLESVSEEDIENEEDYFSMMQMNIDTLETALNE